jgi:hypothetical protein
MNKKKISTYGEFKEVFYPRNSKIDINLYDPRKYGIILANESLKMIKKEIEGTRA